MSTTAIRLCVGCGERPARPDRRRCNGCSSTYIARKRMTQHAGESTIPCPTCNVPYNQHAHCPACGFVVGPLPHALQWDADYPQLCFSCVRARKHQGIL